MDRDWRKSTYSGANGGNCVEVASTGAGVAVRDSMNPDGAVLLLSPRQWATLVARSALGDTALHAKSPAQPAREGQGFSAVRGQEGNPETYRALARRHAATVRPAG